MGAVKKQSNRDTQRECRVMTEAETGVISTSQGLPGTAGVTGSPEEARDPPLEALEGAPP